MGQTCAPAQNDSILASAIVKHVCSNPEALEWADDSGDLENHSGASPLFIEPGHHRFCGCDANCSHPVDLQTELGHFIVEGPYLNQSAQCDLGSLCIISQWRGVGISVNDSIILQKQCRTKEASAHQRRADISFSESMSWFELHLGFLDPGIGPRVVELCWCPAGRPCVSAEEFLATALQLRLVCPPGQYELSETCEVCPVDHYCPGGEELHRCPAASTALAGSRELSDCKCLLGRYWDAGTCRNCPAGSTTSGVGATALTSCTCMPGYVSSQPDEPSACEQCGLGFFCMGGTHKQPCAPSQTTEGPTAGNQSQCVCMAGTFPQDDGHCVPCAVSHFKDSSGNVPCSKCGPGTFSNTTGATEECECSYGYGYEDAEAGCIACPAGEYKANVGNLRCDRCSVDKLSMEAATSVLDCLCRPGTTAEGDGCRDCSPGFFCNNGEELRCTSGSSSSAGSSDELDCLCLEGHYSLQSDSGFSCEPCQAGRYKPATANQQICPSQCPTNSDSPNASTSLSNCSCIAGFYAELDEAGLLVRCASCNSFTHLSCFGGFYEQTDRHRLPVARPGYFQTAPTTAIKCNVVMDDGISACLGGGLCAEGSETLECMGRYSNACAEGSTGFLCGECPPGWARNYWKEPCRLCTASWPLIFSVLLDVGTKVFLNFVVTSLAATAAVRGSGKLHAIMIRIATQWLAACSVVATLDLDQMSPLQMRDLDGPEGEVGLFAWPVEVTVAMLRLFEFLTLTPVLTTVDLDAQCFSQEFSQNPAAPRIALGIYYLSLPLLVMLGSVLLSWAAVRLLVPLANRIGFSFSEAGRRRQKRTKALEQLLQAIQPELHHAQVDLSWEDLEDSGALLVPLAELEIAAAEPGAFLRRAVVDSPSLLLRACTLRARATGAELKATALDLPLVRELATGASDFAGLLDEVLASNGPPITNNVVIHDPIEDAITDHDFELQDKDPIAEDSITDHDFEIQDPIAEDAITDHDFKIQDKDQKEELPPSRPTKPDSATESLKKMSTVSLRESRAAQLDMDLDVDEAMDSLDFGLFSPNAPFGELLYQCLPVVWVAVVSLWPGLLSSFLRMIWCVPIWEEDLVSRSRLRLLPNPDVVCWSDEHFPSAALAVSGLVVWCVGIPLVLAAKLSLEDRTSPDKHRRYGYFFQGLEPQYWWWDILVKRADVGLMMLVTYTSVVREPEAKVLLFPLLSGLQALLAAWFKPYANDQAQVLDVVDVMLSTIRFLLFGAVAAMLILNTDSFTTRMVAYILFLVLLLACVYFFAHLASQMLRDAVVSPPKRAKSVAMRLLGAAQRFALKLLLPVFREEAEEEMLKLTWSFGANHIRTRKRPRNFRTSFREMGSNMLLGFQQVRDILLRTGPQFQHLVLYNANEEFAAFWLQQLNQDELPGPAVVCSLATAHTKLPALLARNRMCGLWMQQLNALTSQEGPFTCTPADLQRAIRRMSQMPQEDAVELVQHAMGLFAEQAWVDDYLEL